MALRFFIHMLRAIYLGFQFYQERGVFRGAQRTVEERIAGHLELLIDSGYVEGLQVLRGADGHFSYGQPAPRLTMAGHDLLDTMRSATIWESIKQTARTKGIELTFDAIKALAGYAMKHALGA